jgi:chaperonin GroEL (HSP60 family)
MQVLKVLLLLQKYEGKGDFGYNAKTDEYVDMLKAIIDPKSNTCSA